MAFFADLMVMTALKWRMTTCNCCSCCSLCSQLSGQLQL